MKMGVNGCDSSYLDATTYPIRTTTDILDAPDKDECAVCGHEWSTAAADEGDDSLFVRDSNGGVLSDGDSVIVIKDLKVKGSSVTLKSGRKSKGIRPVDRDHDVDCKVDSVGAMLESCSRKRARVAPQNASTRDRRSISSEASSSLALGPDGVRR